MIFRNFNELLSNPISFLTVLAVTVIAILIAITVHEFSHALIASKFGDPTPSRAGRLSLNPIAHIDPLGAVMMLLVGFGWAKPVPVNAYYFGRSALQKMALVGAAGPLSNIVLAVLVALPFRFDLLPWPFTARGRFLSNQTEVFAASFLALVIVYNLILGVFNLIPVAPLDGSKVLPAFLPKSAAETFYRLEPWGPGILLTIIVADSFLHLGILQNTIGPVVNFLSRLIAGHPVF